MEKRTDKYESKVIDSVFRAFETSIQGVRDMAREGSADAAEVVAGVKSRLAFLLKDLDSDLRDGRQIRRAEKVQRFSEYISSLLSMSEDDRGVIVMSDGDSMDFKAKGLPVEDSVVTETTYRGGVIFSEEDGLNNDSHIVRKMLQLSTGELILLDVLVNEKSEIINFICEEALPGSYSGEVERPDQRSFTRGRVERMMVGMLYHYHVLEPDDKDRLSLVSRIKGAVGAGEESIPPLNYGEALTLMRSFPIVRSDVTRFNFTPPSMGGPSLNAVNLYLPGGALVKCLIQCFGEPKERWRFLLEVADHCEG